VLAEIFTTLKDYVAGRKKPLEMAVLARKLSDLARQKVESLYLLELVEEAKEPAEWDREIEATLAKLKEETLRRKMADLTDQIKEAERRGQRDLLGKLQQEFAQLGKRLVEKP